MLVIKLISWIVAPVDLQQMNRNDGGGSPMMGNVSGGIGGEGGSNTEK